MKINNSLLAFFCCLICMAGKSQVPATPVIHYAHQEFKEGTTVHSLRKLAIAQGISPRVCKPGAGQAAEKIAVLFKGDWLDITNEVFVSHPGVNFSRIAEKGNKDWGAQFSFMFPPYTGPAVLVEFQVLNNAMVGTHGVHLRRPNLTGGKDETVFYLEVVDMVRIHSIKFKKTGTVDFRSTGRSGETGTVLITGQNLDRISGFTGTGPLRNVAINAKTATSITLTATLGAKGKLGYTELMNVATPAGLKNLEYPVAETSIYTNLAPGELEITQAASVTATTCTDLQSVNTTVTGGSASSSPGEPNLQISFENVLKSSGSILLDVEKASYGLCPAGTVRGTTKITAIPDLTVRITNTGAVASRATALYICTIENSNFIQPESVTIPALGPGSFTTVVISRVENRVRSVINASGLCERSASGAEGVNRWTDLGLKVSLYNRISNGNLQARNSTIR